MSSASSASTSAQSKRRFHARRRMEGLIYVDLGPDNGAILIDLGEGGLGFQSVVPVSLDQAVLLKFKVPGEGEPVEGYAEVAWLNESGKGGGLRFVELTENARAQIRGWTGELEMPEPGARQAVNGAGPHVAQGRAILESVANSTVASAPGADKAGEAPTEISESLTETEPAQPPSPEINGPINDVDVVDAGTSGEVLVGQGAAPSPSPVPEFAVEITAEADANEPVAPYFEAPMPVALVSATDAVGRGTAGSSQAAEQKRNDAGVLEGATPENSPSKVSARPQTSSGAQGSKPGGIPRASDRLRENPQSSTIAPAKPVRAQPFDFRNLAQTSKRQRKASPTKSEPYLSAAHGQDSVAPGVFSRQSPKPPSAGTEWENPPDTGEDETKPQPTLQSQALKIGIGAGAGASLVLVLVFVVPFVRTLVQTTANARSAGLNLANAPTFQVEVADLNSRRWVLRSGGDAGSPFSDTPSRRETQSPSNAARKEFAKSSRSEDSQDSTETVTALPQPKLAHPKELALSRPVAKPADAPAAQLVAPSIFDGITPPIGSLTDRLPTSGPDMPGIVSPAAPVANRAATLQSAVLLQRVAPVYPTAALQAKIQGEVSVNATIGKDGVPKDLKVIKGDERLVPAAFVAIRQWRYRPATLGGVSIETQTVVTVSFELK
jgi:periplasmic protein TonB